MRLHSAMEFRKNEIGFDVALSIEKLFLHQSIGRKEYKKGPVVKFAH